MPTISEFNGIVITMNYREHGPPHVHVRYGEFRALVGIDPVKILKGRLPPRVQRMVIEWVAFRRPELLGAWFLARSEQPLPQVAPMD